MTSRDDEDAVPAWPTVGASAVSDHRIFGLQTVERRSPRTGRVGEFKVLHMDDWVNVVALTPDRRVVLIEQFRHGTEEITLEIPGGLVDPGEAPAEAARRELREETGYGGAEPVLLGEVHPNPAIQTNVCTTWLVRDARPIAPPRPDDEEHIAVTTAALEEIPSLIRSGRITHALVVAAFHHLDLALRAGEV
ncbi:MAG: NUDIX hydrolase [Myxococcota bacterium]